MNSLGIDIKDNAVAFAYLKASLKGSKLAAHTIYSLEKEKPLKEKLGIVRELASEFIQENRINGSTHIYMGIPGNLTIFKEIEFPLTVKENLRATLRYEMEKHVPIPADDLLFDYQILSENKGTNRLKVLLMVIKKNSIAPYLDFSGTLSNGISGIETDATALANFIAYTQNTRKFDLDKELLALLRIGTGNEAYSSKLKETDFSKTGIPSDDLVSAFGLALKGVQDVPVQINLLPSELQKKPSKLKYYMMIFLIAMTVLAGLAWGGSHLFKQRLMLRELDTEMQRLVSEVKNIDRIQGSFKELEDKLDYLNSLQTGRVSALEILRELTQIIPETAWIQDLSLSEKGIQLSGYATSASDLIPLLENSPIFQNAVFLSTITKDRDGKERFRIGMKLEVRNEGSEK